MTTHVIILAQGSQTRLPGLRIPKQLLEIRRGPVLTIGGYEHGPNTILDRMMWMAHRFGADVTVVCGDRIHAHLHRELGTQTTEYPTIRHDEDSFGTVTLSDPGNSSLKGVHQALAMHTARRDNGHHRTAILLGDVVYSWKCLLEILSPRPIAFVGTSDLGRSEGEIWGISWNRDQEEVMRRSREAALAEHPPAHFTEYQPGQLRRWLWAHCNFDRAPVTPYKDFYAIDDYTRDIDIPAHFELLPALARAAYEDDLRESGRLGG